MNKILKTVLIIVLSLFLLTASFLAVVFFVIAPKMEQANKERDPEWKYEEQFTDKEVTDDETNYRTLTVVAVRDVDIKDIKVLANEVGANVDESLKDIQIFLFTFPTSESHESIDVKSEYIGSKDFVEKVYSGTFIPTEPQS